ncbi:MAG: tryptophan synthase subunit alpha [Pseudomonadota bacterium]
MSRLSACFEALADEGRAAFVPFIMAGDPSETASFDILSGLPGCGADIIELGVAFTDPAADGPVIQEAGRRALDAGQTLTRTLNMVERFRASCAGTPIVLMGYLNPIEAYGLTAFATDAARAGVDGVIVVDAPPEEDGPLRTALGAAGLDFIRLATPTSDEVRMKRLADGASGFMYYVSITGVTGTASSPEKANRAALSRLRAVSRLPVALGFGIKTPAHASAAADYADAVVVGSALVACGAEAAKQGPEPAVNAVLSLAAEFGAAVRGARVAEKS